MSETRGKGIPIEAVLVTGLSGLLFVQGFTYREAYLRTLGVPPRTILFEPQHYLVEGFHLSLLTIGIFLFIAAGIHVMGVGLGKTKLRLSAHTLLALGVILMMYLTVFPSSLDAPWWWFALASLLLAAVVLLILRASRPASWLHPILGPTTSGQAVLAVSLLALAMLSSSQHGEYDAERLVAGRGEYYVLTVQDSTLPAIQDQTFILVARAAGYHYLLPLGGNGAERHVLVVSDEAIVAANLRLMVSYGG
jgi:hypothetical protein